MTSDNNAIYQIKLVRQNEIKDDLGDTYVLNEFSDGERTCYLKKRGWLSNAAAEYSPHLVFSDSRRRAESIRISPSSASDFEWAGVTKEAKKAVRDTNNVKGLLKNIKGYFGEEKYSLTQKLAYASLVTCFAISSYTPKTHADLKGNLEYINSEKNENSVVRTNAFYTAPFGLKAFTFLDFKKKGKGYAGKTSLEKEVVNGINVRGRIAHINEPVSEVGVGMSANIPYMPKNTSLSLRFMPQWFSSTGKKIKDKVITGFSGRIKLPKGFNFSMFGQWNIAGEKAKWTYGEARFGKKRGPLEINYGPSLIGDGDAIPEVEHKISLKANF